MKLFACLILVAMAGLLSACQDTPAYSAKERSAQIDRNIDMSQKMMNDDIDHFLLLRPSDGLSIWNVYHRD